jgi:hypothetical protein
MLNLVFTHTTDVFLFFITVRSYPSKLDKISYILESNCYSVYDTNIEANFSSNIKLILEFN